MSTPFVHVRRVDATHSRIHCELHTSVGLQTAPLRSWKMERPCHGLRHLIWMLTLFVTGYCAGRRAGLRRVGRCTHTSCNGTRESHDTHQPPLATAAGCLGCSTHSKCVLQYICSDGLARQKRCKAVPHLWHLWPELQVVKDAARDALIMRRNDLQPGAKQMGGAEGRWAWESLSSGNHPLKGQRSRGVPLRLAAVLHRVLPCLGGQALAGPAVRTWHPFPQYTWKGRAGGGGEAGFVLAAFCLNPSSAAFVGSLRPSI